MPYIFRDEHGKITKASARAIHGAELVPHNHPEVMEFLRAHGQDPKQVEEALNELRRTDVEMSRAIEDVIMALLKKNILKLTDMPKAVQDRMALRVRLRLHIQEVYEQASGMKG